jgi:hypothetical protein
MDNDDALRKLMAEALVPPELRPETDRGIEAMLDANAGEPFDEERIEHILAKARGDAPIGDRRGDPETREECVLNGQALVALYRRQGKEITAEVQRKMDELRRRAWEGIARTIETMSADNWRIERARIDAGAALGESIAAALRVDAPPVDPLRVLESEGGRIEALGEDFGDAFDGRLEYRAPKFLLFYNTKYDAWPHQGRHHPKVRFTIAHEMGHFYLDAHRDYLVRGGEPHGSVTDFTADNVAEREADAFAAGLLMPSFMLRKIVNREAPTMAAVKSAREKFDVSLTSMLVRWVQLSDFPCAVAAVDNERIRWGFTSEAFKKVGAYAVLKGKDVSSPAAIGFIQTDPGLRTYHEGSGWGGAHQWMREPAEDIDVKEEYAVIPSLGLVLVLLSAGEDEVFEDADED